MARRIFAKAPDGSLVSRQTHRDYTHAIIVPRADVNAKKRGPGNDRWLVWGWTRTPERMLRAARRIYSRAIAVPVDDGKRTVVIGQNVTLTVSGYDPERRVAKARVKP